ncbi:hypothetical protein [Priestia aryabhattai]
MNEYQYEAECHGCYSTKKVNHIPLCASCNNKLERDLVRQRNYEYSDLTAQLSSSEDKEKVRKDVINQYGEKLELVLK